VSTHHNGFFQAIFSEPENAVGLLRALVDPAVAAALDWSSLRVEAGSYVSQALRERRSDLLFSVRRLGGARDDRIYLYVLVEHQSAPDAMMPVRFLEYMMGIWADFAKEHGPVLLPLIVPIVVYHGDRPWTARRLTDCLAMTPEQSVPLRAQIPDFELIVDDLSHLDDAKLRRRALTVRAKVALAALRDGRRAADDVLAAWFVEIAQLLVDPTGLRAFELLVRYLASVRDDWDVVERRWAKELGPAAEAVMMTTAERWMKEGEARGRAEGKAEGRAESIFAVLRARRLDVAADVRSRVLACRDVAILDRWLEAAVTAASADDIFV
jgi:predicted transposase/invertase (TIGR01784 family)